jgi:hypothetical protein
VGMGREEPSVFLRRFMLIRVPSPFLALGRSATIPSHPARLPVPKGIIVSSFSFQISLENILILATTLYPHAGAIAELGGVRLIKSPPSHSL